jgi:hypothetical protein
VKEDLLFNPNYLLHDVDLIKHEYTFMDVTKKTYTDSSFLDMRMEHVTGKNWLVTMPLMNKIIQDEKIETKSVCYIFHISFVASTLLSRCLNKPGKTFSLREPWILRRLADTKRGLINSGQFDTKLWLALVKNCETLLVKNYEEKEKVIIKPTNVANNLIEDLKIVNPESKSIFLYTDLHKFLITNLNKTTETKLKMPLLAKILSRETSHEPWMKDFDFENIDHLKACCLIWYFHLKQLIELPKEISNRILPINIESFFKEPKVILQAVNTHLGLVFNEDDISDIIKSPTMSKNAKSNSETFNASIRNAKYQKIEINNIEEINQATRWFSGVFGEKTEQRLISMLNKEW